jgi:putative addiction module component (TIGR02574 family)
MDALTTLDALSGWPVQDRLELVYRLWDQILDEGWQPRPGEELKAELRRRIAAYEVDPTRGLTWEQVEAHIRRPR